MDNKKWYKRFGTIFWWTLTILPLLLGLIYFIGYHLTFNSGITSASDLTSYHESFMHLHIYYNNAFRELVSQYIPAFLYNPILSLFTILFDRTEDVFIINVSIVFSWGVWIQMIHLFFDVVCWLPNWCHSLMCKFGGE